MEKWEYHTVFLYANVENPGAKEFLTKRWPNWKPTHYSPQILIPDLNTWGEQGWELVHIEPVIRDRDDQVVFAGYSDQHSNCYFCALKRRKEE